MTIESKVNGIKFPVELAGLVLYFMQISGNFDLRVIFTGIAKARIAKASFAKASFSQFWSTIPSQACHWK